MGGKRKFAAVARADNEIHKADVYSTSRFVWSSKGGSTDKLPEFLQPGGPNKGGGSIPLVPNYKGGTTQRGRSVLLLPMRYPVSAHLQ